MNRSIVDRSAIDADLKRRRAEKAASRNGGWASKVVVIPAVVAGLVNRILHREAPAPLQTARRRAGVYVWRQEIGQDGKPEGEGEIVPVSDAHKYRGSGH